MTNVEITLEFFERPTKQAIYALLEDLMRHNVLRYDIGDELDAQLTDEPTNQ